MKAARVICSILAAWISVVVRADTAEKAVAQYEKASSILAGNASLCYALGKALRANGDFKKALELDPKLKEAHMGMGHCHGQLGDIPRAIMTTEACLAAAPDDAPALINLALFYEKSGKTDEARKIWMRLKETAALDVYCRRAAAHLEQSTGC